MGKVIDSRWDLRLPWQRQELRTALKKALRKAPLTTRELAATVQCSVTQARRMLDALWTEGEATFTGDTRDRTWTKSAA
jgi:hypothetical protein